MSARGRAAKRDAAEKPIVDALRRCGARVWPLSGPGLPDLLVLWQGTYTALEVKTGTGRRTKLQRRVPWPIVRTVDEAFGWVGIRPAAVLTLTEAAGNWGGVSRG
jgi:Holliday junction resolvase